MIIQPSRRDVVNIATGLVVSELAAVSGAAGMPAMSETASPPIHGTISATDFGAIGDGGFHPLSERFTNLEQAQRTFPNASSLVESLDGAAIQAAFDQAERLAMRLQAGRRVFIPAGRYPLSRPLRIPNGIVVEGEGPGITIIDNQNTKLTTPLAVNKNTDTAHFSLCGLSLHGGSHGVKIDVADYVDGITIHNVSFQLQTDKNLECNKLFQMASFRNCTFGIAPYGVYVAAWTSNVLCFEQCSFENHSKSHLYLRGAECINIIGGRFEGGGTHGSMMPTLDVEAAASFNIEGVYFENTHEILLRERRSRDGVRFNGCHFSGATGATGLIPYRFDSDGIVQFGANDWGLQTIAPDKAMVNGINAGLAINGRLYVARTARDHQIRSERVYAAQGLTRDILMVRTRQAATSASLAGTLNLTLWRMDSDGLPLLSTFRFDVAAAKVKGGIAFKLVNASPGALVLRPVIDGDKAVVSMVLPRGMCNEVQWTFMGSITGGNGADVPFDVDLS